MDSPNKKQRLELLINQFGHGKKSEFARAIGVSPQAINSWITRDSFDIELIYAKCIGISAHWLLTGEGDMLTGQESQQNEIRETIVYKSDPRDIEMIELQRKHILLLEEQRTLCPARLDFDAASTDPIPTPIPSFAPPKRAKTLEKQQ